MKKEVGVPIECIFMEGSNPLVIIDKHISTLNHKENVLLNHLVKRLATKVHCAQSICRWRGVRLRLQVK